LLGPGGAVIANLNKTSDTNQIVTFSGGQTTPPVVTPPVVTPPVVTPPVTTPEVPSGSPKFTSELTDASDGDHNAKNGAELKQTVNYTNLNAGQDYVIVVELLDATTQQPVGVVKDKVFRPSTSNGTTTLSVPTSSSQNGKTVFAKVRLLGPAGAEFSNVTTELNAKQSVKLG
jgi:hypothetical protein